MQIRVLGPVQFAVGDQVWEAGPPQRSLVFAALAVDAGRLVSMETLIDRVWGEKPPRGARRTAQTQIAKIRGLLKQAGLPGAVPPGRRGGYVLDVDPDEVDVHRFRRLAQHAANPDQPVADRVARWRETVGLWRGQPLAGLPGDWAERIRTAWHGEFRDAVLAWSYAEIQVDNPTVVIDPLTELIDEDPVNEALPAMLMRVLYAAGRRADALTCFKAAKQRLRKDRIPPGAELTAVHQAIVNRWADIPAPPGSLPPPDIRPAQLIADVNGFAGRGDQLVELDGLRRGVGRTTTAVVIAGTAGVGKTALAVHWAHQAAKHFPDGQLYVDLRGFHHTGTIMDPAEAIRRFLDALGVHPQRIPADPARQVDLYRTLLADKKMLVLLDNARDPDQVQPLLPGAPGCLVLVTSRNRLAGLAATVGAHSLPLDLLPEAEARDLLARRIGHHRVAAEPDAVDSIITACARLPLALAIVAANAQPRLPLAAIADQLRDSHDRLEALSTGDTPKTDVRAVFSWSYHALNPDAARLFRLLGLHPGPDISIPAAASLAAVPLKRVRLPLAELARANLIVEHIPGRYAFHDLLRAYANHLAGAADPDDDRAAVHRVLDHYVHTACAASRLLDPHRDSMPVPAPQTGVTPEPVADYDQALDWFTAEHRVLLIAADEAAASGHDTHVWRLAWTLTDFLDRRGHWHDRVNTWCAALAAADRLADPAAQAHAHRYLAHAYLRLNRFDDAHAHLRDALALSQKSNDLVGQAHTQYTLGVMREWQDRHAEALEHRLRALKLFRSAGHARGEANALNTVGWNQTLLGHHWQALAACRRALALLQQLGDPDGEASTWDSLGHAHHQLRQYAHAVTSYQQAVDLFHDLGDRYNEADTLVRLGDTHNTAENPDAARDAWQQALTILDRLDHPEAEQVRTKLVALNSLPAAAPADQSDQTVPEDR